MPGARRLLPGTPSLPYANGQKITPRLCRIEEEISFLNGYHIAARYPNGLPDGIPATVFNRKPAEEALRAAKRAVDFVEKLLNE